MHARAVQTQEDAVLDGAPIRIGRGAVGARLTTTIDERRPGGGVSCQSLDSSFVIVARRVTTMPLSFEKVRVPRFRWARRERPRVDARAHARRGGRRTNEPRAHLVLRELVQLIHLPLVVVPHGPDRVLCPDSGPRGGSFLLREVPEFQAAFRRESVLAMPCGYSLFVLL